MASAELPPELAAGLAAAGAGEVISETLAVTAGLDVGVITGSMLPMFSAGIVGVEAAAAVGLGAPIGVPTGAGGSAVTVTVTAGAAADRDGAGDARPLGALVGLAVTVTTAVACALVDGFVAALAKAVRLTHAAPLAGTAIPALRVNNDGVTSSPGDPS